MSRTVERPASHEHEVSASEVLAASERETQRIERELEAERKRLSVATKRGDREAMLRSDDAIERMVSQLATEERIRNAAAGAAREEREQAAIQRFAAICDEAAGKVALTERAAERCDVTFDEFVRAFRSWEEHRRTCLASMVEACPDRDLRDILRGQAAPDARAINELLLRRLRGAGLLGGLGHRPNHTDGEARLAVMAAGLRAVVHRARQVIAKKEQ